MVLYKYVIGLAVCYTSMLSQDASFIFLNVQVLAWGEY